MSKKSGFARLFNLHPLYFLLIIVVFCQHSGVAQGADIFNVTSTLDGNTPYQIRRVGSSDSTDKLEEGIYWPKKNGQFELFLPGHVLSGGAIQSVFTQFGVGKVNRLYPSLSIVNGRIYIFQHNLDLDQKPVLVELGGQYAPVKDVNGNSLILPNINSLQDFQVYSFTLENFEFILISLHSESFFGTGITFVTAINADRGDLQSPENLLSVAPTAIDYNFQTHQELSKLITSAGPRSSQVRVFSRLLIQRILKERPKKSYKFKDNWYDDLQREMSVFNSFTFAQPKNILAAAPQWNVLGSKIVTHALPEFKISASFQKDSKVMRQVFDPVSGIDGIILPDRGDQISSIHDIDITGHLEFWDNKSSFYSDTPILFGINKRLYMMHRQSEGTMNMSLRVIPLMDFSTLPEDFTFYFHADKDHSSQDSQNPLHYLFISYRATDKSETCVLAIEQNGIKLAVKESMHLNNEFYPQQNLLHARVATDIAFRPLTSTFPTVLFDAFTPNVNHVQDYEARVQATRPYKDIGRTMAEYLAQPMQKSALTPYIAYTNPIHIEGISSDIKWARFEDRQQFASSTGFYLFNNSSTDQRTVRFLPGELLTKNGLTDRSGRLSSVPLTVKIPNDEVFKSKVNVNVFASDSTLHGGNRGFELITSFSPAAEDKNIPKNNFGPSIFRDVLELPFSLLEGVQILTGQGKNSNEVVILALISQPINFDSEQARVNKSQGKVGPGLWAFYYKLDWDVRAGSERDPLKVTRQLPVQLLTAQDKMTFEDIFARITFDQAGDMFFIVTPNLAPLASDYQVIRLFSDTLVPFAPNKGSSHKIRWVDSDTRQKYFERSIYSKRTGESGGSSFEDYESKYSWGQYGDTRLEWAVRTYFDMQERLGVKSRINENRSSAEIETQDTDMMAYFPELPQKLDQLLLNPGKRVIMLVSESKKEILLEAIYKIWLGRESGRAKKWVPTHFTYNALSNYEVGILNHDRVSDQQGFRKAFMRFLDKDRPKILLADLSSIEHLDRVEGTQGQEEELHFLDPVASQISGEPTKFPKAPHAMYWLSTEGNLIELDQLNQGQLPPFRTSQLLIGTPAELDTILSEADVEAEHGLINSYTIDHSYLWMGSRVVPPVVSDAPESLKALRGRDRPDLELQMFPDLLEKLHTISRPETPAQRLVILVPQELKGLIKRLIDLSWAHSAKRGKKSTEPEWSFMNPDLALFNLNFPAPSAGQRITQENVLETLEQISDFAADMKPVILEDISVVHKLGRPDADLESDSSYILRDPALEANSETGGEDYLLDEDTKSSSSMMSRPQLPHMLWLLASSGQRLHPYDVQNLRSKKAVAMPREFTTILLGTSEEWNSLQKEINFEKRFGLDEQFDVMEFKVPSVEARVRLLDRLATAQVVRVLDYKFEAKPSINPDQDRVTLLTYMVNTAERHAIEKKENIVVAFLRLLHEFSLALSEDLELRRTKIINRGFIDRLFYKVFNLQINTKVLPPHDWLHLLMDPDFSIKFGRFGYPGPLELKEIIRQTILSMTMPSPGKNIPASIFLYGDTSTGKSHLIESMINYLGLKLYDFHNPENNDDASAIIIRCNGMPDDESKEDSGRMSVKTALRHVNHFLTLPNGYRGLIFFDDIHKGESEKVLQEIIAFQLSLLDAPGGFYDAKDWKGRVRSVPVRNTIPVLAFNPITNKGNLANYAVKTPPDDWDHIVASIRTPGFGFFERSSLARFGIVLRMSLFPIGAKSPRLMMESIMSSKERFNSRRVMQIVTPEVVSNLSNQFPDENAREFFSPALLGLFSNSEDINEVDTHGLQLTVPMNEEQRLSLRYRTQVERVSVATGGGSADRIETAIRNTTRRVYVNDDNPEGKLFFTSYLVDRFRKEVYESFITHLSESRSLSTPFSASYHLAPALHSLVSHLQEQKYLPLNTLQLDPREYGAQGITQKTWFMQTVQGLSQNHQQKLDIYFNEHMIASMSYDAYMNPMDRRIEFTKSRSRIFIETIKTLQLKFVSYLESMLRVGSIENLPNLYLWLDQLTDSDPKNVKENLGQELYSLWVKFANQLNSEELIENKNRSEFEPVSVYESMGLFQLAIDKAIMRLPWGKTTHFLSHAIEKILEKDDIGQRKSVQHYLFKSAHSPLVPILDDAAMQLASTRKAFSEWSNEESSQQRQQFIGKCSDFLLASEAEIRVHK